MTDEPTNDPERSTKPGSIFGNLPDSRPGTRSPRRGAGDRSEASAEKPKAKRAAKPKPKPPPKPKARPKPRSRPAPPPKPERSPEPEPESRGGGLEDIAWAGVAAAAEAATIGVRLVSRAIEALRGGPEKK